MARPQNKKRQRADEPLQDNPLPAKRVKRTKSSDRHNFPPAFWDSLSKVWLTPRALRELDRRNNTRPSLEPTAPKEYPTNLSRFARRGGPDLCHLRGFPEPKGITDEMSSGRSSASKSRRTQSTKATSVSKARKSSAYNDDFEQYLIDHAVYPEGYEHPGNRVTPEPLNLDSIHESFLVDRASLSPSRLQPAFRDFKQKNRTKSEDSVMCKVIPIISGDADIPNEHNLRFTNLTSLTNDNTVQPQPDYFDGARAGDIHHSVKHNLNTLIIPTKHAEVPVVPNFFLEAKAPRGGTEVAQRQACYDGAYGARAMHALQNYGRTNPIYDGNAYTFSATYHDGLLKMYAHHVTAPTTEGEGPEYHMTKIRGFDMMDTYETFIQGATAFRNARDLAKQHRDKSIEAANAKARQAGPTIAQGNLDAISAIEYEDSADEFATLPPFDTTEIQQEVMRPEESSADELALSSPRYLDESDGSQDLLHIDPPTTLTTSFTSSFSSHQTQPKRARQSVSPPSKPGHSVKRRAQPPGRQTAASSTSAAESAQSSLSESHWVETYRRNGKTCFRNLEGKEMKTELKDWMEQTAADGTRCFCWQSPGSGRAFWAHDLPREGRKGRRR